MRNKNKANVTLKNDLMQENGGENEQFFPCQLCGEMILIKYSIKNKPYYTCNECGVQVFIRGAKGINKFQTLISDSKHKFKSKELINLIDFFEKLNEKLNEIKQKKPFFGENEDLNIQEKAIKKQLEILRKQMKSI